MNPQLVKSMSERALQLYLMGFSPEELRPIVESEQGYGCTDPEWETVWDAALAALRDFDVDFKEVDGDLNLYLKRSDWMQQQLLAVFQGMLKNYNAYIEGKTEHDEEDPETGLRAPVIAVRPLEIAQMAERIMKIDETRISAKLNYPLGKQKALEAAGAGRQLPPPTDVREQLDQFADFEVVDADYQEA